MKILVISLAGIGDTLFATPLIHELRLNFPQATIDAFVLWPGAKDMLESNPHLNRVHQQNLIKSGLWRSLDYLGSLRRERYDVSFSTHPQSRIHYRMVARLINARQRISHRYENFTPLDAVLVSHTLPQNYECHCIENNLALLRFVGAEPRLTEHDYEVFLSDQELQRGVEYWRQHQLQSRLVLGIHPGSGGTKNLGLRRWPIGSYAQLINRLAAERPGLQIMMFGGPDEREQLQAIEAKLTSPQAVLRPQTRSLRDTAALVKQCSLFLSVDTALMHVAAAMKVPGQIVIETPSWNRPIFPYRQEFIVVPNPAVAGKNLSYYRYDGQGIKASAGEVRQAMESVSVEAVFNTIGTVASRLAGKV